MEVSGTGVFSHGASCAVEVRCWLGLQVYRLDWAGVQDGTFLGLAIDVGYWLSKVYLHVMSSTWWSLGSWHSCVVPGFPQTLQGLLCLALEVRQHHFGHTLLVRAVTQFPRKVWRGRRLYLRLRCRRAGGGVVVTVIGEHNLLSHLATVKLSIHFEPRCPHP